MADVIGLVTAGRAAARIPADTFPGHGRSSVIRHRGVTVHHRACSHFSSDRETPISVLVRGRLLGGEPTAPATGGPGSAEEVARLFAEAGRASFSRLDGEFALTLIDHRSEQVYLVRDRVGTRPWFWARTPDGGVAWASECKLLLPLLARRRLDAAGLAEILKFRWLAGDRTLFAGIHRVLPGSWVVLERGDRTVTAESHVYWRFETQPEPADRSLSEWVDEAEVALEVAIRRRVAGARKSAVLLSGGVDSPVLSRYVKRWAKDYALISPTWKEFDDPEIPRAIEYGRLIGGDHRVVVLDPAGIEHDFVHLNRRFEQPARSPHALTLTRLSAQLEEFDLLVHGEGADAMFGADRLRMVRNFGRKRRWLDPLGPLPRLLAPLIPGSIPRFRRLHGVLTQTTWDMIRAMGDAEHEPWLTREWAAQGLRLEANVTMIAEFVAPSADLMTRAQCVGLYTAVQDHLEMLDRLFGPTPVHVITPLLTPEIFALARRLPAVYKLDRDGRTKPILKALSRRLFPPHMADAQKLGFPAPTLTWLLGPLSNRVERLQAGTTPSAELFGHNLVKRLALPADLQAVWTLICLDEIVTSFGVDPAIAFD
jgi:asparagine synthase (glutamine-hydrolysing)